MSSEPYDLIFAGGGTVACIVAGRLAAADPSLKILIIEAGAHSLNLPVVRQPARYLHNLLSGGSNLFQHISVPSPALGGRSVAVQSGKCMGGGSAVNFLMYWKSYYSYTRASSSDFNAWSELGIDGWSGADLIPLAKKLETYQGSASNRDTHGADGPIHVSKGGKESNVIQDFFDMAKLYDKERGRTDDTNDFSTCDKYSSWDMYIDAASGVRSDTAHHYIYNQLDNKNIHILTQHRVIRVLFEDKKAVGVEYVDDSNRQGILKAFASRMVILSAGSFGSVAILERSGIGAADVLAKNGIQQLVDLPGVGDNYNDHNIGAPVYFASDDSETLDEIFSGNEELIAPYAVAWEENGKGFMAHNAFAAGIKMRPSPQDLKVIGPDFAETWTTMFEQVPDKPMMAFFPATASIGAFSSTKGKFFTMCYYTEYPRSLGRVHVQSAIDPHAPMEFDPGYLQHPADLVILRWAYKKGREMARRMKCYRGELPEAHPKFAPDSAAALSKTDGPVSPTAPDIVYSPEDDAAIDDFTRATVGTTWHSLGTCAMKSRDKMGVVDASLNVYGVSNLKVADLSVSVQVGANTCNTAMIIGEKAAIIFAKDLGVRLE